MALCSKERSFPIYQPSDIRIPLYTVILVHWKTARLNLWAIKSRGHLEVILAVAKADINRKYFCISQVSYFNQVLNPL